MKTDDFPSLYAGCSDFVRLHSWCDQSEEKIAALYQRLQEHPEAAPEYEQTILDSFGRLGSREERLMALAVLHRLNVDAGRLADLTLLNLDTQINEKDGTFILDHYFGGVLPVPAGLVYDITKGNFITYKRAIYRALQVSQFDSTFDPGQVLLFLVQLLCRDSLNEQNRAIVYLLISRIDIDLPEGVGRIVVAAMVRLRNLINEVEKRQEAVLADEMGPEEEELGSPPPDLNAAPSGLPPRGVSGTAAPAAEPEAARSSPGTPAPQRTAGHVQPPVAGPASPRAPRPALNVEVSPTAPPPSAAPPPPSSARVGWVPAAESPAGTAVSGARSAPAHVPEVEPGRWAQQARPDERPRAQAAAKAQAPEVSASPPAEPSRFVIRFNRESREFAALREQMTHPAAAEPAAPADAVFGIPATPAPSAASPRSEPPPAEAAPAVAAEAPSVAGAKVTPQWIRWLPGLGVAVLVAAVAGLVVWGGVFKHGLSSGPSAQASAAANPSAPATPATGASGAGTPAPAVASAPAAQPVVATAGSPTWSPRPGESLWSLFQSLRNGTVSSSRLAGLSWGDFVKAVQAANPAITEPGLIFTTQTIRLPAGP